MKNKKDKPIHNSPFAGTFVEAKIEVWCCDQSVSHNEITRAIADHNVAHKFDNCDPPAVYMVVVKSSGVWSIHAVPFCALALFLVWLLTRGSRSILVDTIFGDELFARFERHGSELLVGYAPENKEGPPAGWLEHIKLAFRLERANAR